LERSRVQRFY